MWGPPNLNLLRILTAGGDVVTAAVENQRDGINKTIRELEKGSVVSVGVMQVSSDYWLEYDVNVFDMWEPCTNITVGTTIFANEYVSVLERTGNETEAMKHSLKQYLESNLFINDADTVIGDMFGNIQYTQKHQKNQNNNKEYWDGEIIVSGDAEMIVSGFESLIDEESNYEYKADENNP